jgi:hypothetical protein
MENTNLRLVFPNLESADEGEKGKRIIVLVIYPHPKIYVNFF